MESIKIVLLKNDLQVIARVSELQSDDNTPYCFLFEVPFVISFDEGSTPEDPKIVFTALMPFTKNFAYRMPFEQVMTMGDPTDPILQRYVEIVKPYYPIDGGEEPNEIETQEETENDN